MLNCTNIGYIVYTVTVNALVQSFPEFQEDRVIITEFKKVCLSL